MDTNLKPHPKVSVLMLVYNGEKYIGEAILSILNQSFKDFELVIINCGSNDGSLPVIKSFTDSRIILINNQEKTGIMDARNQALQSARGEFIAWLDCDDRAHPKRLEVELDFLKNHHGFGMVGSVVALINEKGGRTGVVWREKIPSQKIPIRLIFGNCFAQSSVMLRRKAIPPEGYASKFAEDYDLWVRIFAQWKGELIQKILLEYRRHDANNSTETKAPSQISIEIIIRKQLGEFGVEPTTEELSVHRANYGFKGSPEEIKQFIEKREAWLLKLRDANQKTGHHDKKLFNEVVAERFLTTLDANASLGFYAWRKFWRSPLSKNINKKEERVRIVKFFIKCLLRRN